MVTPKCYWVRGLGFYRNASFDHNKPRMRPKPSFALFLQGHFPERWVRLVRRRRPLDARRASRRLHENHRSVSRSSLNRKSLFIFETNSFCVSLLTLFEKPSARWSNFSCLWSRLRLEKEEDEIPLLSVLKEKLKKSVFWGSGLSPIAKKILTSILAAVRFLALQLYLKFLQSYSCNLLLLSFVTEHETKLFFEFNATPYVENQISEMGVYILSFLAWV